MKALKFSADALVILGGPSIEKAAQMVSLCAETQIDGGSPTELEMEMAKMKRSLDTAVNTLRCDVARSTYLILHRKNVVQAEAHIHDIAQRGADALIEYKKFCAHADYTTDLKALLSTLSDKSHFGMTCLAEQKYSYTAMRNIERIIINDAFLLSVNAFYCNKLSGGSYNLNRESALTDLQQVLDKIEAEQDTNAWTALNETLLESLEVLGKDSKKLSDKEIANSLFDQIGKYNSPRAAYMVDVVPTKDFIGGTVLKNAYFLRGSEDLLLRHTFAKKYEISVFSVNYTDTHVQNRRTEWMRVRKMVETQLKTTLGKTPYTSSCPDAKELLEQLKGSSTYVRVITTTKDKSRIEHRGDDRAASDAKALLEQLKGRFTSVRVIKTNLASNTGETTGRVIIASTSATTTQKSAYPTIAMCM
uniref:SUI1 domain-containing protein n=1 Tax=Steinernema glaseri TaxID=37863 RepID=A0A1I7ZNR7_9BILA